MIRKVRRASRSESVRVLDSEDNEGEGEPRRIPIMARMPPGGIGIASPGIEVLCKRLCACHAVAVTVGREPRCRTTARAAGSVHRTEQQQLPALGILTRRRCGHKSDGGQTPQSPPGAASVVRSRETSPVRMPRNTLRGALTASDGSRHPPRSRGAAGWLSRLTLLGMAACLTS